MSCNGWGRRKEHDPKSRKFAYPKKAPEVGVSVRHRLEAPNVDQFYTGGCVGFSATNLLNTRPANKSRKRYNEYVKMLKWNRHLDNNDGLNNYSNATKRDEFQGEYPPIDEGSSALGIMKYWNEIGVIGGYDWAFTFEQTLAALQRQPVLFGVWWYEGLSDADSKGIIHVTGDKVGGHEILADAIIYHKLPSKRYIGLDQSWGEEYGLAGKVYIPWEEAEVLLDDEGDVAIPRLL